MSALVSAGVIGSGGTVRFTHPILRAAIYGDLSAAERERLHCAASKPLEERGRAAGRSQPMSRTPSPVPRSQAVRLLRVAARDALVLGDATGAAAHARPRPR